MDLAFEAFPKIPRKLGDVMITEKIDGTNAQVIFARNGDLTDMQASVRAEQFHTTVLRGGVGEDDVYVLAGSRNRYIQPGNDNFTFARYVLENAAALYEVLGLGKHYGEWYGQGIQRRYGLEEKRFALFNAYRWKDFGNPEEGHTNEVFTTSPVNYQGVPGLSVVPVLHVGSFEETPMSKIEEIYDGLQANGSQAVPGWAEPEGIVVRFSFADKLIKLTDNGKPHVSQRNPHDLPPDSVSHGSSD